MQHWRTSLVPDLRSGATVLVVAHSNSLRALVKHIDEISDDDIVAFNIPTGMPLLYQLDDALRPITPGGRYLDVDRAVAAVRSVANEGRTTKP
jgi:2,3-bisphosphoglycerate-dependent phosphoglycerate mutase